MTMLPSKGRMYENKLWFSQENEPLSIDKSSLLFWLSILPFYHCCPATLFFRPRHSSLTFRDFQIRHSHPDEHHRFPTVPPTTMLLFIFHQVNYCVTMGLSQLT
jgi:hypothetical protein